MKIFLIIICCFFTHFLNAQTILEDAKAISNYFNEPDEESNRTSLKRGVIIDDTIGAILSKYIPDGTELSLDVIDEAFKGNPFLRMEVTDQNELQIRQIYKASPTGGTFKASGSNGFFVANLADGMARFLVKRTKQELSQVFFENFKEKVKKDPYLGNFCPFTQEQLLLIDSKVYQFNDYLETLREGFTADMTSLPSNTERFLKSDSLCSGCADKSEGKVMIDFFHIAQQLVNGESQIDILSYLANPNTSAIQATQVNDTLLFNMAAGLRFLNLVSESLRNTESKDAQMPWYSANSIRTNFQNPKIIRIYLGLLWQKSEGIEFVTPGNKKLISLREIMRSGFDGIQLTQTWRNCIETISSLLHTSQMAQKSNSTTPSTVADDFFAYSQSITDILLAINQTGRLLLEFQQNDIIPIKYILLMRQCNALYFNVRQKNYGDALSNVIYCLNLLKEGKEDDKNKIAEILRYANFMAKIAEANSTEELEQAIEIFALPPGSSQAKKFPGRISVAINAYTGIAGGWEYLGSERTSKEFLAITAPVGLSCAVGLKKVGSIGVFVPFIDIGAVTAYRFNDENAGNLPELSWNNIISPGLYAVYNTPGKFPFALGYGAQIGPSLRKVNQINDGTNVEINKSAWRQGFFLSVDIPIAYLYLGKGK